MVEGILRFGIIILWALGWIIGGYGWVRRAFHLNRNEEILIGITAGFLLQGVLVNLLAQLLPLLWSAWIVSILIGVSGVIAAQTAGRWQAPKITTGLLGVGAITLVGFLMARGLAIFDDFAHLPTISLIAADYFPPRFAYDPDIHYGYHHFLLLVGAQIMRLVNWYPWSSFDAARAISFGIALGLASLWGRRITCSHLGAVFSVFVISLTSGTRWLMLTLPYAWLERLSSSVNLLGSGLATGETLSMALFNDWAVGGGPPLPYPFAFANGLIPPGILALNSANGLMAFVVPLFLLLTATRWREPRFAAGLSMLALAAIHLVTETDLPLGLAALVLVSLLWMIRSHTRRLPERLTQWWVVILGASLLGVAQGGTWGDIVRQMAQRWFGSTTPMSYQTLGFEFSVIPSIVSPHLGVLPLTRLETLMVALAEIGPLMLAFPLLMAWGLKSLRAERWFESLLTAQAVISLAMLWVQFSGSTGVRNTSRLYAFLPITLLFFVPLLWTWLRQKSLILKYSVAGLAASTLISGVVLLAFQMPAIGRPVASYDLTALDVRMFEANWNRLERDALIFDSKPSRAPTLFGRFTLAGYTWYHFYDDWKSLSDYADPIAIRQAGFDYAYLDSRTWEEFPSNIRHQWEDDCVHRVDSQQDRRGDFRWLLDLRSCDDR